MNKGKYAALSMKHHDIFILKRKTPNTQNTIIKLTSKWPSCEKKKCSLRRHWKIKYEAHIRSYSS